MELRTKEKAQEQKGRKHLKILRPYSETYWLNSLNRRDLWRKGPLRNPRRIFANLSVLGAFAVNNEVYLQALHALAISQAEDSRQFG